MFKKSLFFVYSLSAIFVFAVLFACGDSGNSPDPGNSSNSNQPPSASPNPANATVTIVFPVFEVNEDRNYLDVSINVSVMGTLENDVPAEFDEVEIYWNGSVIHTGGAGKNNYTWSEDRYDISKSCSGEQKVCALAYLEGKAYKGTGDNNCKSFTRTGLAGSCKSSNSLAPLSSSSAMEVNKNISFERVKFNGVNSVTLNLGSGIILNSGTVGTQAQSDIYYDSEGGQYVMKTEQSTTSMIDMFTLLSGQYRGVNTGDIPENSVTPQQFGFRQEAGEKETEYKANNYFAVRTKGSTEWDTNCYLVLWPSNIYSSDGKAEIKVWKVVQN